jgi:hypothetical protein
MFATQVTGERRSKPQVHAEHAALHKMLQATMHVTICKATTHRSMPNNPRIISLICAFIGLWDLQDAQNRKTVAVILYAAPVTAPIAAAV